MNLDYQKLLASFEEIMMEPSFYWQASSIILCLLAAYFFYKFLKKSFLIEIINKSQSHLMKGASKYFLPLIWPIIAIIFLSIGRALFSQFYEDNNLFFVIIQIVSLLLLLRFLRIFFGNSIISNLMALILIPVLFLSIVGFLDPAIKYLDSFAINIGSTRISIYLIVKGLVTLLILIWISNLISRRIKNYVESNKTIKSSTKGIISKVVDLITYFVVFVIIMKVFGVDMTTFAVLGGAIGVGIGFGLQKIASNFISGVILLFEKSVEVGDLIELEDGSMGTMTYFGGRYIVLETFDGKEIMVPNEDLITKKVTNLTYNNARGRVEIKVGIAYNSDVRKAQELMLQAAREHPKCLRYPTVDCFVTNFADSGIELILFFWISNVIDGRLQPKSEVMLLILDKFREHGIEIPFPQMDIYIKNQIANLTQNKAS